MKIIVLFFALKPSGLLVLMLAASLHGWAQVPGDKLGCADGDCANGWGTFYWTDGSHYVGFFKDKKRDGYGFYHFSNGDEYIGYWKANEKDGTGIYNYTNSIYKKYVGEWRNGLRDGTGLMVYTDGRNEFGIWKAGTFVEKTPRGKYGCVEGDCNDGYGVFIWSSDERYYGQYVLGKRNGFGRHYYPRGGKYEGYQQAGYRNGVGTYFYPSGNVFIGDWVNEKKQGEGVMLSAGMVSQMGIWDNNELVEDTQVRSDILARAGLIDYVTPQTLAAHASKDQNPPVVRILKPESIARSPIIVAKGNRVRIEGLATDDSGIAKVRVNGLEVKYNSLSNNEVSFDTDITLAMGQTSFWIEATDRHGNALRETYNFTIEKEEQLSSDAKATDLSEKRSALIIGNSAYAASPLRNPVNDAKAMTQVLGELGFEVTMVLDGSKKDMFEAVRNYGEKLRSNGGVGLFYYAGHGLQSGGSNYLVPIDADIRKELDIELEAVELQRVLNEMAYANNRMNIVVLDACRDNPFAMVRSLNNGLASVNKAAVGTFIAYSTAPGMVAHDGEGINGLYTQELLKALKASAGKKLEDVFKEVRSAVRERSKGEQIPWENSSIEGDFYFVK